MNTVHPCSPKNKENTQIITTRKIAILGNGGFSPHGTKMKKIRPVRFFHLLKVLKTNWFYFSTLGLWGPETVVFWFSPIIASLLGILKIGSRKIIPEKF